MRVVYTSDLHSDIGPRNAALLPVLAAHAAALSPDVFLVAGDLAETAAAVTASLERFAAVPGKKLYLAGNHDLYVEGADALRRGETSRTKFETLLPQAAVCAGFAYLGLDPVWVDGVAFVGVPGWFDWSLRDPGLDVAVHAAHYGAGAWRGIRAFERGHVLWPRTASELPAGAQPANLAGDWAGDEEIHAAMLARLDDQLRRSAAARALVAAVHVLPFLELVQRNAFGPSAFHDAWLGSAALGARLLQEPRLRAVVCGHLHRAADVHVGGVPVVSRPLGRVRDTDTDLGAVASAALGVLEIDNA